VTYIEYNSYCQSLTGTSYIVQWGGAHVWKVGGKVFAIGGWEKIEQPAFTLKTSEADFYILTEEPGFRPAPYMASRGMKWVQIFDGNEVNDSEIRDLITQSHRIVSLGLTKKKQKELGLNQS
jgi:predicted DNA-binding protein (MmcQ/YjbR family)